MTLESRNIYSPEEIVRTYEKVHDLLITRYIIKAYSTNRADIRNEAIRGMDLKRIQRVMELGCGYGFFIEKMKGLLDDKAVIVGIDMVEKNREPFLHSVASIGYRGEFIAGNADVIVSMETSTFDCIIASYSLYFFPHLIPVIARLLTDDGVFITITHSRKTLCEVIQIIDECMEQQGIEEPGGAAIERLFTTFPLEEGLEILKPHFGRVDRINYNNSMIFPHEKIHDLFFYLRQKQNLIYKKVDKINPDVLEVVTHSVEKKIAEYSGESGRFYLNKDDAIFRCYQPVR